MKPSQVTVVGLEDLNQSVATSVILPSKASVGESSLLQELSDLKEEWSTRFAWLQALLIVGSNPLASSSAQPPKELVFTLV